MWKCSCWFFSAENTLTFYTQYLEQHIHLLCLINVFMILFLSVVCENEYFSLSEVKCRIAHFITWNQSLFIRNGQLWHCPAEFNSNPDKKRHMNKLINVFRIHRKLQAGEFLSGLKLNAAGSGPLGPKLPIPDVNEYWPLVAINICAFLFISLYCFKCHSVQSFL